MSSESRPNQSEPNNRSNPKKPKMKICAVKGCQNTSISTPIKHLFYAPSDYATRGQWIRAIGKDYSHSTKFFICEDHFDFKKDVDYVKVDGTPKLLKFTKPTVNVHTDPTEGVIHVILNCVYWKEIKTTKKQYHFQIS